MPHLKVQDTEIYYEVHGDGPPFLFCSVTGLDHQAWKFHQVREFSRDHKVIVFDYRGTGKSSKAVQKYSIKMFTDDAAAIRVDHEVLPDQERSAVECDLRGRWCGRGEAQRTGLRLLGRVGRVQTHIPAPLFLR